MKPDFALFLSFEGITLLFRAGDGWRHVGDVTLVTDDLTSALSSLRTKALALAPTGPTCKIVLPNDQIRYLTLFTGSIEGESRTEMARAALEGATPYDVADLVFDLSFDGEETFVAAVAQDTLDEAEGFARLHGFVPVGFTAVPEENRFVGEPAFWSGSEVFDDQKSYVDAGPTKSIGPAISVETAEPATSDAANVDSETPDAELPVQTVSAGFASRRAKSAEGAGAPSLSGATRATVPAPEIDLTDTDSATGRPEATEGPGVENTTETRPDEPEPKGGASPSFTARFLSRRKEKQKRTLPAPEPSHVVPAPTALEFETNSETERMTIFGARDKTQTRGRPRHLGLSLTAGLLVVLGAVAVWSAFFTDNREPAPIDSASLEDPALPASQTPDVLATAPDLQQAPDAETTDSESADLTDPETGNIGEEGSSNANSQQPDIAQAADQVDPPRQAQDDVIGLLSDNLQQAPIAPDPVSISNLDDLYAVSIDSRDLSQDAVALPSAATFETDEVLATVSPPAAAGTEFAINEDGLVEPTVEGALTPDGILVFLGRPPVVPPATPTRFETEPEAEIDQQRDRLAALRPNPRPSDLLELNERDRLGGLTRAELGNVRPRLRPETVKREAELDETPTAQAIVVSRVPKTRPRGFEQKVQTAKSRTAGPSQQVAAATVAPRTVSPRIPSSASVARRATMDNAINLRRINLIGVYGTPSDRRALVRLPSGRYKKVKVGDNVDGGRVVAIGDSELRYQKGGRNVTLKIPSG